jgi:acyl-CoA hydrolase
MSADAGLDFNKLYATRLTSLDEAMRQVKSRMRIVTAMAAAEPRGFFERFGSVAQNLQDVEVLCANPTRDYSCFSSSELAGHASITVMFLTSAVRKLQGRDIVHYAPQHLSRWAHNVMNAEGGVDIFWGSCTTPDKRGFVSLGPNACYESEILRKARHVILEVNPFMPVTFGGTHVHTSAVNQFVEYSHELPTCEPSTSTEIETTIGNIIGEMVPDGATLQLGIGGIPNAVGKALAHKKDLGIHTEMINDSMMELAQLGVINGSRKTIWPGKIVGAFAWGTRALYDFLHENPMVELQPASVVNDPWRIGRNHLMHSINTAVEIDITGQVCSESVGHRELSGVGGASETHIGAQRSPGGRGIIAIPSTTKDGKASKIVFELKPGAKVSISRNDVDTVVTEYGVAKLAGKNVSQRVRALVGIAHPAFRDELLSNARREKYL